LSPHLDTTARHGATQDEEGKMPQKTARKTPKPTAEDAAVMLSIARLDAANGIPSAMNWLWSDKFVPDYGEFIKKNPAGSDGYGKADLLALHYETIGTLWKHKLINEELLFDWLLVTGVWDRLKSFVLGQRRQFGQAALGENFQKMANAQARRNKASR
jgi:hypothetical protein